MTPETIENQPQYKQKTIDAFKLVQMGLEPKEALKAVNYRKDISAESVSKFKAKLKKHSLQAPQMVKLAHNAVKDCLTDQPIKSTIKKIGKEGQEIEIVEETPPTWTNKIAAASMVMDRYEPVINKSQTLNVNVDATPVDLSRWRNELSTDSKNNASNCNDGAIDV